MPRITVDQFHEWPVSVNTESSLADGLVRGITGEHTFSTHDLKVFARDLRSKAIGAEWFDFGEMTVEDITKAMYEAKLFLDAGDVIDIPHDPVVFRMAATSVKGEADAVMQGRESVTIENALVICHDPDNLSLLNIAHFVYAGHESGLLNLRDVSTISNEPMKFGLARCSTTLRRGKNNEDNGLTCVVFLALWLVLHTKSFPREVIEVPDKLNKARKAKGRVLIPRITKIDGQLYTTAIRETERRESTGASSGLVRNSPHPHIRRAHDRHYLEKTIRIHRSYINFGQGKPVPKRERYVVKSARFDNKEQKL